MRAGDKSLGDFANTIAMIIAGVLFLLSPLIIIWLSDMSSSSSEESGMTSQEAAQYEDYKSDQMLNENRAQEACMDQEARDVERYGEWVTETYNCSQ